MKIVTTLLIISCSLLMPYTLFSAGLPENAAEAVPLQERYDALVSPGMIMLPISGTSVVSADVLTRIEYELLKQLIDAGKFKPVRMQGWLLTTYTNKANTPFAIMNNIKGGRYNIPLVHVAKPFVFKSGNFYYFTLSIYPLATYYPITILRQIDDLSTLGDMIASCIEELTARLSQPAPQKKIRIVIDDFKLDFLRLIELRNEFEFISAPFIEKEGVALRDGDDFFSRMMGYILTTTNLFQVIQAGDFKEYSNMNINPATTLVDYRMRGRVQLSEKECILYVDISDIPTGTKKVSLRYPLLSYSFKDIWNAYRKMSVQIAESLCAKESYSIVPRLFSEEQYFFTNNMFVGWDTLEDFVLAKGLYIINIGTPYRIRSEPNVVNSYHVLLDKQDMVFYDNEGRRVWNLLAK